MNEKISALSEKLERTHSLTEEEYAFLIDHRSEEAAAGLAARAAAVRKKIYGSTVYIRGLIEISNICKNDCLYCGIRRSNRNCERYRLSPEEIISCAEEGHRLGFRTFVLQGGEDGFFTDDILCGIVSRLK